MKQKLDSKKIKVFEYLKKGNSITPRGAMKLCDSWRLSDIIFKLRKEGYKIVTEIIESKGVRYASYRFLNVEEI